MFNENFYLPLYLPLWHQLLPRPTRGTCGYKVGGFNVSNLMGIKWRMIDIGKKITFYFLQNTWKCTVFPHLHFKIAKSAILTPKNFFFKNINKGIKIDSFQEKNIWVIIALFPILKCKWEKNCTFSNILQKVKHIFFQYLSFSVWRNSKKV